MRHFLWFCASAYVTHLICNGQDEWSWFWLALALTGAILSELVHWLRGNGNE